MTETIKDRGSYQPKTARTKSGNEFTVFDGGVIRIKPGGQIIDETNQGTPGTGVTAAEKSIVPNKTILTVNQLITMTDAGASGNSGSILLYTFPAGNIQIVGAVANLSLTAGAGGISDTAALVSALGSVAAAADATLTSTEANIIPSTVSTLTGGVGAMNAESTAPVTLNGTVTPAVCRLNAAVPDADSTANDTVLAVGTVELTWFNLGDN